ncbi:AraC family transcriptional regulator [Streptomyces sp. ID05-04B]|uniref:AraC family transcriptional regulator n=1 Tax=unclassified Streptomyces TaxID=2593676 RepID=UPI000D1AA110|nr:MULTISPECIES: AraC family transcriptional regulator [unclassified Streptomyces]AVV42713.1 AraC family transcriptional regulator [Streptomyces sp. P3]MDX5568031.1 AraC family transcriptional regulator [Streptomyces sp. ID05-04B]
MIGTAFRTADVPVADRFEYWRQLMDRTIAPSDISSDYAADFRAEQRLFELGAVRVWPIRVVPTRYRRSTRLVRQSDPEEYHLSLVLGGGLGFDHVGRSETYGPQDLWLSDSSRPYVVEPHGMRASATAEPPLVTGVGVEVPKSLLPLPSARVRDLLGRRLSGREGPGALLTGFLSGLDQQAASLRPADAPRLGMVLVDLLAAWLAHELEAETALSPEARRRITVTRIRAFIRQHLHDPELRPPVVAAAHHISLSYLHRLFQEEGTGETVAAWIRGQRLAGARRDLADPALLTTPVHVIAARWGILRASDFTRAFRAAYGMSPTEYRFLALTAPPEDE